MRTFPLCASAMALILSEGCHRASPSEVGTAERASAFPKAEMAAARRASDVSPGSVAQSALGPPMREAAVGGVPPVEASHSQSGR